MNRLRGRPAGSHDVGSGADLLAAEAARAERAGRDVQYSHTEGVIDLTWGHPDPSALAVDAIGEATESVLAHHGWTALAYGAAPGAITVREAIADHETVVDHPISPDEVLITAGSSGGLDLALTLLTSPGDVVFVERPTYFLALRIFGDHQLEIVGLENDTVGPDPDDLARRSRLCQAEGRRTLLYLVSTFANPTGRCLDRARAEQLLDVARSCGVTVIDDDVYRDTAAAAPASLRAADPSVFKLGSFSKSLSPGLRVGYLVAPVNRIAEIAGCGVLDSGGGVNHFAAMVAGEVLRSGRFDELTRAGQSRYERRRRALVAALREGPFQFEEPAGGFFVWLTLADGLDSADVVAVARRHGVLVSDGRNFFDAKPPNRHLRLSFSMLDEPLLVDGAAKLIDAVGA